jgi:protein-S-isoprenylcysteine O-methyltransferase Ste14
MRATEFEFRYRFFLISAIYVLGFSCYAFDRVNTGVAVTRLLLGHPIQLDLGHDRTVLQLVFGFGALLAFAAAAIRTWAAAYLKSEVVHDLSLHGEALVADGPFRHARNPLYLGGLLLGAGMGFLASRTGWVVIVVLLYVFQMRLIRREEALLRESQGDSYARYCAAVPQRWPALRPRVAAGKIEPQWKQAFLGESFMWAFALGTALYAATLSPKVFYGMIYVVLLGYAIYVFGLRRWRKRRLEK